jgi:phosphoglycerate dehydrogenase-like enzyme
MDAGTRQVLVLENVWGAPLAELERDMQLIRAAGPRDLPPDHADRIGAVLVRNRTTVDADFLDRFGSLVIVARAGVGLDNIDVRAADERGIVVVAPHGANAVSVAEHAVGLALALARHVVPLDRSTRAGSWDRRPSRELGGGTWGLLGAGATGLATAAIARGLDMRVIAHDPYADSGALAQRGITVTDLDDVARQSDVVSCHLPATPQTAGLVGERFLNLMSSTALLVNVGRGEVVDEDALVAALRSGEIAGAALDVRASEPPRTGALEALDNVILTPHVAGITHQSQDRILTALAGEIRIVLAGGTARLAVGAVAGGTR